MTNDTRKRYTFRIPETMYEMLKEEAKEQGTSLNALMLQILREWVNSQRGSSKAIREEIKTEGRKRG